MTLTPTTLQSYSQCVHMNFPKSSQSTKLLDYFKWYFVASIVTYKSKQDPTTLENSPIFSKIKSTHISDYRFLEENIDLSTSQKALVQAVPSTATWKTKAKFLHLTIRILYMFCCITLRTAAVFYLCKVWQKKFWAFQRRFLPEGRVAGIFLLPNINSMIRLKSLDLLRSTSNKTPLTLSKYHLKYRDFLKCPLPHQEPRMMQPPSKFLPIYYHKRLPWNTFEGLLSLYEKQNCFLLKQAGVTSPSLNIITTLILRIFSTSLTFTWGLHSFLALFLLLVFNYLAKWGHNLDKGGWA